MMQLSAASCACGNRVGYLRNSLTSPICVQVPFAQNHMQAPPHTPYLAAASPGRGG